MHSLLPESVYSTHSTSIFSLQTCSRPCLAGSSELVAIAFLFALTLCCLNSDLFVIFLQCSQIFGGLRKLALLHPFADVPVHKGALAVHQVKLVVDSGENLCNCSRVTDHTTSSHNLGQISAGNHSRRLIIDAALEPGWAPIHKLNSPLCFDRCHSCIHILGYNIAAVHHATRHVLA